MTPTSSSSLPYYHSQSPTVRLNELMQMRMSKKCYTTEGDCHHMLIGIEFMCNDWRCVWFCVLCHISSKPLFPIGYHGLHFHLHFLWMECVLQAQVHISSARLSLSCSSCEVSHTTTVIKEQGIFCLFSCLHWLYWKLKKCMWDVSKLCFFRVGKMESRPTYSIRI